MDRVDAFALPGGQIFVTRGMLEVGLSDDALAALLGLAQPIQAWSGFQLGRLVPTVADKAAGN